MLTLATETLNISATDVIVSAVTRDRILRTSPSVSLALAFRDPRGERPCRTNVLLVLF